IITQFGLSGLLMVTMMAGVILLVMGLTGLGTAIKFIPRPVTIGFTNGIAVLIASTQIKDFLGLRTPAIPGDFPGRIKVLLASIHTVSWLTVAMSVGTLLIILALRRVNNRLPGAILAVVLGAALTAFFALPLETIGTRFGGIPSGL